MTRAWADWWRGATSLVNSPSMRGPTPFRLRAGAKSGARSEGRMRAKSVGWAKQSVPTIYRVTWATAKAVAHPTARRP